MLNVCFSEMEDNCQFQIVSYLFTSLNSDSHSYLFDNKTEWFLKVFNSCITEGAYSILNLSVIIN